MKRRRSLISSASVASSSKLRDDEDELEVTKKPKQLSGKVKKGSFEHRFERRRYLTQLVREFETTQSMECKQQVLANLANFAYDSYNYNFFQEIGVIPIFLAEISVDRNPSLTEFAMAGICNCVTDKRIHKEVLKHDGLSLVKRQMYSSSVNTQISAITCMIYLLSENEELRNSIVNDANLISHLRNSLSNHDKRLNNVIQIILDKLK